MLTETVDRLDSDWNSIGAGGVEGGEQIGLIEAFLNPLEFNASGINAEEAAGVIAQGMTRQRGSEIDEFRNFIYALLGLTVIIALVGIANTTRCDSSVFRFGASTAARCRCTTESS